MPAGCGRAPRSSRVPRARARSRRGWRPPTAVRTNGYDREVDGLVEAARGEQHGRIERFDANRRKAGGLQHLLDARAIREGVRTGPCRIERLVFRVGQRAEHSLLRHEPPRVDLERPPAGEGDLSTGAQE